MIEARSTTCIVYRRIQAQHVAAAAAVVDGAVIAAAVPSSSSGYGIAPYMHNDPQQSHVNFN